MASSSADRINVYAQLSPSIQKNSRIKLSTSRPFTPEYVQSSLDSSKSAQEREDLYRSRILGRQVLLENPARESRVKKEAIEKKRRRNEAKRKKGTSLRDKNGGKGWKLDPAQARFSLFIPLHHLWMGYMSELLGLSHRPASGQPSTSSIPASSSMHPKLVKADFHGSIITVKQAENPCLVSLTGIVIYESENAFHIITKENKVKLIPKQNTVFTIAFPLYSTLPKDHTPEMPFPLPDPPPESSGGSNDPSPELSTVLTEPNFTMTLYGNQFCFRSADRAGRKFKNRVTTEL